MNNFESILGVVIGGGTWVLLRDVSIAIGVAFLTGYAAYWGRVVAQKMHEKHKLKYKKDGNTKSR